jgi:hypothetical protein
MRPAALLRSIVALTVFAGLTACDGVTAPAPPLDEAGVVADLAAANSAAGNPAVSALAGLGTHIGAALGADGGALGVAVLPAHLLQDPTKVSKSPALQRLVVSDGTTDASIPAEALGRTFVYDTALARYVVSDLLGAPINGVRFVLYAVDPVTERVILPLVRTGFADITRTLSGAIATARVEAYADGAEPEKVLDYSATIAGAPTPTALVEGFAKQGGDSLTFRLETAVSLVASRYSLDWRSEVPTRAFVTRVTQALTVSGETITVAIDALLRSGSGAISMHGTVDGATGGTITVKVNGSTFATLETDGTIDGDPVILGRTGEPLTPAQEAMLRRILRWFAQAFRFFGTLLSPVEHLLSFAIATV